ncbi:iron-containing alcohol dehydrogenase [Streptomyces parvus]|uniref:iron-containing alcohol dehydrogenase n=1 Tax=Streptomyces parvus TaxID=66428 RepID=UPI0033F0D3F9
MRVTADCPGDTRRMTTVCGWRTTYWDARDQVPTKCCGTLPSGAGSGSVAGGFAAPPEPPDPDEPSPPCVPPPPEANPDVERVREAVAPAREFSPDAVVGIGGGSAMDVAKCVAVLVGCTGAPAEYLSEPGSIPDSRTTPLTQVPTITGSGSELTSFATIYVGHHKHSLDHPSARADHVLIDPDLAATVPVPTAAASALDALAQAVESAWAVAATAESRDTAIRALETLLPPLDVATGRGDFADPGLRAELARGTALAGAAINTSRTTAAHALSYALTARHGTASPTAPAYRSRNSSTVCSGCTAWPATACPVVTGRRISPAAGRRTTRAC